MKRFSGIVLCALMAAAPAARAQQEPAKEAAVTQVVTAFFNAWNIHDVKTMASLWTDDATLINPSGRMAHGTAEIEKLFSDEQTTMFKNSTAKVVNMRVTRWLGSSTAFCDGDITVDGAVGPDGSPLPQIKTHLVQLMQKKDNRWLCAEARPYRFVAMGADSAGAAH